MKTRISLCAALLGFAICLAALAAAKTSDGKANDKDVSTPTTHSAQDDPMRLEGEKRFHSNCGRCHAAPPKFPSRMMATIIRHMRVRATLTEDDMHLILHYMTR